MKTSLSLLVFLLAMNANAQSIEERIGESYELNQAETYGCPEKVQILALDRGIEVTDFAKFENIDMGWSVPDGIVYSEQTMSYRGEKGLIARIDKVGTTFAEPNTRMWSASLNEGPLHLKKTFSGLVQLDCTYR